MQSSVNIARHQARQHQPVSTSALAAPCVHRALVRAHAIAPPPPSSQQPGLTYKQAGVDIAAGDELVRRIKAMNPSMNTGFSGYVPFGDSYLVSGTDGVGTKLKLAFDMNKHDTVSPVQHSTHWQECAMGRSRECVPVGVLGFVGTCGRPHAASPTGLSAAHSDSRTCLSE